MKSEIDGMRAMLQTNMPDKYNDIIDELKKHWSLTKDLQRDGYEVTWERLNKLHHRMSGIIDRFADIGDTFSYSQAELKKEAKKLNARLSEPMKFMQANNGKVNPFFDSGLDEHQKNCQRCAIAFEMRMRGLDVYAGDYKGDKDTFFDGIDSYASEVWINSKTHKPPQKHKIRKSTFEDTLAVFNEV